MNEKNKNEVLEEFNETYKMSTIVQKPFGEAIREIIKTKGLTIKQASELTGLNEGIFYSMRRPNPHIEIRLVISICIGFKLDSVSTQLLLQSAGCGFNMNNRIHRAYLYVIEYYKDSDIEYCNEILECLGIPKSKRLGSASRGPYKPRKRIIIK